MKQVFKAVVLDLDDTLTVQNSLHELASECGVPQARFAAFMRAYRIRTVEPSEIAAELLSLLRSVHGRVPRQTMNKVFQSIEVRSEAWSLIAAIRIAGCTLGLISSSFDDYVAVMADRFGIEDRYSNIRTTFDADDELCRLDVTFDAARLKHSQLHDFCRRHGYHPTEMLVVGDNDNDLQMFACTGSGVLLSRPHNRGFRQAAWQVVDTLDQVSPFVTARSADRPESRCAPYG